VTGDLVDPELSMSDLGTKVKSSALSIVGGRLLGRTGTGGGGLVRILSWETTGSADPCPWLCLPPPGR
jgi:hypothetical protein